MEDVELEGATVKRGERLMINYPAMNRDPNFFERADEVVLDRELGLLVEAELIYQRGIPPQAT